MNSNAASKYRVPRLKVPAIAFELTAFEVSFLVHGVIHILRGIR